MSEVVALAGLRGWFAQRPLASYAVAGALGIALYELLHFLRPVIPAWVTTVIALGAIACGVVLTVQRIRRPLLDEGRRDAGWTQAPTFILIGALILIMKYVPE